MCKSCPRLWILWGCNANANSLLSGSSARQTICWIFMVQIYPRESAALTSPLNCVSSPRHMRRGSSAHLYMDERVCGKAHLCPWQNIFIEKKKYVGQSLKCSDLVKKKCIFTKMRSVSPWCGFLYLMFLTSLWWVGSTLIRRVMLLLQCKEIATIKLSC